MEPPQLSREIVDNRRAKAPMLKSVMESCESLRDRLAAVRSALQGLEETDTPEMKGHISEMERLTDALDDLRKRAELRHARFSRGLVTIAIAGLEKAGKTTFLRSLTGIDALPAFDERCTAVLCEIHYDKNRSDFDLEFYTEDAFYDRVLRPALETAASGLPDEQRAGMRLPESAAGFATFPLPSPESTPGGTTAYKLLRDLHELQAHFDACRAFLGRPALLQQPLPELGGWVSHRPSAADSEPAEGATENGREDRAARGSHLARISAVKVCRIHTPFRGGSDHLRWIDTPGVDDPNRRARDLTLSAIAEKTDLLVVASRPGATPSAGESFHRFWDSVSRQPDEIDLMSRLLFALNWDKRVDPDGENIKIHRRYLIDAGVPAPLFIGPFEATDPGDAAGLMDRANSHLSRYLPDQDDRVCAKLENGLKHLKAKVRLLYDALSGTHPSDAGQQDLETEEFHRWFHWYHGDEDSGFWADLVTLLDRSARTISDSPRIQESEEALNAIFAEEAAAIQDNIPTAQALEEFVIRHRGESPIPHGMRTISTSFSRMINRLADEVQEFGPFMQEELVKVLTEAGLEPLLSGETSAGRLSHLLENFQGRRADSPVIEVLRETIELPRNLKYVLRYELRGAVDFCDPTLWDESETAWNRLRDMVTANNGDLDRLASFPTFRHPPVTDSREQDSDILKRIAGNAMLGIHAVLNNERYLPRRIADDFMRDCRVRLVFAPESEQEWRSLLYRNRGALLAQTIGQIRSRSERIQAFHGALGRLEAGLD